MHKVIEINTAVVARFRKVVEGMVTATTTTSVDTTSTSDTSDTVHTAGTAVNTFNAQLSCSWDHGGWI